MVSVMNDSRDLANELRPVLTRLARELRREVHSLGISGGQVTLLAAIKHAPGVTASALAEQERISPPAMSNQLARLEAAGLIARTRGELDRRRIGLALTPAGEKVLRSVRQKRTAWLASRLDRLTDGERDAVEAAIAPLGKLLGADAR
jgi:DNA-binding MarR family transcriptional regulator